MSAYLSVVAHAHRTRGNSPLEYAVLALAVALLLGATAFLLLLALVGAFWALAAAVADVAGSARDRLAAGLLSGRAVLANRLRLLADLLDPHPATAPLSSVPSWEPADEDVCSTCHERGWSCNCMWSPVDLSEGDARAAVAEPEPAAEPEVVYLPLTGTVAEVRPEPVPLPAAAQETEEPAVPVAAVEGRAPGAEPEPAAAAEAATIRDALARHGSVRAAAKALGVAESTLRRKCRRLGINAPRAKRRGQSGEAA
jgi:hypothetical protein